MADRLLAHDRITAPAAAPRRWLLVLHGVFGRGRNWATVARRVVRQRSDWGAVLVDLREHGRSRGMPPPHTLAAAAADVAALAARLDDPAIAVLGHSFGGKVALLDARARARSLEQVWVVDAAPGARPPGGSAWEMLGVLRRIPRRYEARHEAVRVLEAEGVSTPVARWMATNLERADGGMRWRLDLDAIEALMVDFFRTDLWDVVEQPPGAVRLHFVKAEDSNVLSDSDCDRIEAAGRRNGRVRLHRVAGGHWLNADNPDAVERLLAAGLPRPPEGAG